MNVEGLFIQIHTHNRVIIPLFLDAKESSSFERPHGFIVAWTDAQEVFYLPPPPKNRISGGGLSGV